MKSLTDLVERFHQEAEILQRWGAGTLAAAVETAAVRVEEAVVAWQNEELTVAEAAAESGYSTAHLRRLLAESRLENAGSTGRPRIRRSDLPRKPNRKTANEVDLVGEVLRARSRHGL